MNTLLARGHEMCAHPSISGFGEALLSNETLNVCLFRKYVFVQYKEQWADHI